MYAADARREDTGTVELEAQRPRVSLSKPPAAGSSSARAERAVAAWEIASVVVSVLIAEWCVFALVGEHTWLVAAPVGSALGLMIVSHRLRGETARELGWRLDNFARAARLLAAPMIAVTLALVLFGWLTSSLNFIRWRGGESILGLSGLGLLWGLLQQYALQGFINRRAQVLWGPGPRSVLAVALVFGLLHLPNPALTVATLAGGALWAWVYQRAPNLWALGLSHVLMTWVLVSTLPPSVLHGLRIGFKYFR